MKEKNPEGKNYRRIALAIGLPAATGLLMVFICVNLLWQYSIALFLITPFLVAMMSVIICGYKKQVSFKRAMGIASLALLTLLFGLLFFGIEGMGCIIMVSPIAFLSGFLGMLIGYAIVDRVANRGPAIVIIVACLVPVFSFVEAKTTVEPEPIAVTTSIEINAPPEIVWKQVVAFPVLAPPTEFMFRHGISYPISARIEGTGKGAIRYCNFSTGSFVEPITDWDEPRLLAFSVKQSPPPMTEWSFWDIDAPHLHDFFQSKHGQFRLVALPGGRTRLEGTTWYVHRIRPEFYWKFWSNSIIHSIHERVLEHIKKNAEAAARP